mmetsp:Transcript_5095/g.14864  ORF Transcript_5095/g.14864 Transcript_5095/m.14864 type:complete len:287 (-) Transcript_5095:79-939(-)
MPAGRLPQPSRWSLRSRLAEGRCRDSPSKRRGSAPAISLRDCPMGSKTVMNSRGRARACPSTHGRICPLSTPAGSDSIRTTLTTLAPIPASMHTEQGAGSTSARRLRQTGTAPSQRQAQRPSSRDAATPASTEATIASALQSPQCATPSKRVLLPSLSIRRLCALRWAGRFTPPRIVRLRTTTCRWSGSPPVRRNALLTAAAGSSATRGGHPGATMATTTFLPTPIPAASPNFRRRSVLHRRERAYGWVRFRQLSVSTALCGDPLCRIPQKRGELERRAARGCRTV